MTVILSTRLLVTMQLWFHGRWCSSWNTVGQEQVCHSLLYCLALTAQWPCLWQMSWSHGLHMLAKFHREKPLPLINCHELFIQCGGQLPNTCHSERDHVCCIDRGQSIHLIKAVRLHNCRKLLSCEKNKSLAIKMQSQAFLAVAVVSYSHSFSLISILV